MFTAATEAKQFGPVMLAIIYDLAEQKVNYTSGLCVCVHLQSITKRNWCVRLTRLAVRIASCDMVDGVPFARFTRQFTSDSPGSSPAIHLPAVLCLEVV